MKPRLLNTVDRHNDVQTLHAHMERSILRQEAVQRAAAGASVQPQHHWVVGRVPLRGHEPAGEPSQG